MGKSTISMAMFNSKLLVYQVGYFEQNRAMQIMIIPRIPRHWDQWPSKVAGSKFGNPKGKKRERTMLLKTATSTSSTTEIGKPSLNMSEYVLFVNSQ